MPVRIVEDQIHGHTDTDDASETFRLITDFDPDQASAVELATAYHQRWEIETAFREIEINLLGGRGLRSKTPDLVEQELWGTFTAHYALRAFMTERADKSTSTPTDYDSPEPEHHPPEISTRRDSPATQRQNRERAIAETLERRNVRRHRTYPRVSKKGNRQHSPTKKPKHRQSTYNPQPVIR